MWNLYTNRPGTREPCCAEVQPPSTAVRRTISDRHLYPSYLGVAQAFPGHAQDFLGGDPARLFRIDVRELPCERSMHPSYLGNTVAWNECRRLKGLPTADD